MLTQIKISNRHDEECKKVYCVVFLSMSKMNNLANFKNAKSYYLFLCTSKLDTSTPIVSKALYVAVDNC